MAKVRIEIEDVGEVERGGRVSFFFTSDPHLPDDERELTPAQKLACVCIHTAKKNLELEYAAVPEASS